MTEYITPKETARWLLTWQFPLTPKERLAQKIKEIKELLDEVEKLAMQ